jgi:lipoprotein signal peptidase
VRNSEIIVKNYGISFGLNGGFFVILSIIFVLLFLGLAIKNGRGYWLIFIGGMANLVERIIFGYVKDYWNFFNLGVYNNINDWIIGIGVLICLTDLLWKKSK